MKSKATGVSHEEIASQAAGAGNTEKNVSGEPAGKKIISLTDKSAKAGSGARRLVSIDAFRGFTILAMLVVNNKVSGVPVPAHLTHASWDEGLHFADLIFPWFLFIVGVVIPYSGKLSGGSRTAHYLKISKRALMLALFGCLINSSYAGRPLFDFGVLQLIGISYFFAALTVNMRPAWRIGIAFALLVFHWAAIRFIPVPGIGAGVFTEQQNLIRFANKNYFEPIGLVGILSVLPTTALALIGTVFGDYIRSVGAERLRKGLTIAAAGAALALAGWIWNLDIPFRKSLWTSSYTVFSAGTGALILGLFYIAIDAFNIRKWTFPFVVFGSNALLVFIGPVLVNIHILQEWTLDHAGARVSVQQHIYSFLFSHLGHSAGGWTYMFLFILFWWLILLMLYRKRIFLRV